MNKKSNIGNIITWIFTLLFFVIGVLNLWLVHHIPGTFYLILSFVHSPPFNTILKQKLGFSIPLVVKIVLGIFILWGTLAVGIFSTNPDHTFLTQLIGVLSYGAVAFPAAFIIFFTLKKTMGVRVSKEHETDGLDSHEHGIRGYTIVVE